MCALGGVSPAQGHIRPGTALCHPLSEVGVVLTRGNGVCGWMSEVYRNKCLEVCVFARMCLCVVCVKCVMCVKV